MKVKNWCDKIWLETCETDELLQDWIKGSYSTAAGICAVKDCDKPAEFGGCVKITWVDDNDMLNQKSVEDKVHFIIPLCKNCLERFGEEYEIKQGVYPVLCDRVFCKPLRTGYYSNDKE